MYFNRSHGQITEEWFTTASGITGAQLKYTWRELEPERGRYDFTPILRDLDILSRHHRRLWIQLQDVSFDSSIMNVPEYLLTDPAYHGGVARQIDGEDPATATRGGWVARRWDPAVRARFHELLDALGAQVDARIEGINLAETAVDIPRGSLRPHGYSPSVYRDGILDNMRALRRAFPRSTAMLYGNFMPGEEIPARDSGYLRSLYAEARNLGLAMGGPDLLPNRPWQIQHSYGLLRALRGVVPTGLAVQWGNYEFINPRTRQRVTVDEQLAFASCYIGVSYLFWEPQEPFFSRDVLPVLARPPVPCATGG